MSDERERAPSTRALGEAGVRRERPPRIDSCRHRDSCFPTIEPRDRQPRFKQAQLTVVR
jgi:hypothetical protein